MPTSSRPTALLVTLRRGRRPRRPAPPYSHVIRRGEDLLRPREGQSPSPTHFSLRSTAGRGALTPPPGLAPHPMQTPCHRHGRCAHWPWRSVLLSPPISLSSRKKRGRPSASSFFTHMNRWRITSARSWRRLPPAPSSCSLRRPWTGLPSEWWESPQQPSWPQPSPGR